jgi:hypothetical protein
LGLFSPKEKKTMRRLVNAGSGKVGPLALLVALVMTLALAAAVSAQPSGPLAPQFPNRPHRFYGNVRTDKGKLLPAGTLVTAKAATGSWTGSVTQPVDASSRYGYLPPFDVPGVDTLVPGSGAKPGDQIKFQVLGVPARLYAVATSTWSDTYTFVDGGHTNLDLQISVQYTIAATAGANGSITPPGAVVVDYGFDQEFTFTPASNYQILDVLVDGVSNPGAVAAGKYTFTNVTANHTIGVTFVRATYYIAVNAGPGCTITPDDPLDHVVEVPYKGSITFNIAANTGYDLVGVTVDGASQGLIPSYTFANVQADHTIAATCKLKEFEITPTAGPGGTITPAAPQTVLYGGSQKFDFTPNIGYVIDTVTVDGVSNPAAAAAGSYTFTEVKANHAIAVTFKVATFEIKVTAAPHGTITPGTTTVNYGDSATFTITPDMGYSIVDVLVDGVSNPAAVTAGSYTFSNVTANHTITAVFTTATFVITPTAGAGGTITPGTEQIVNYGGSATFAIAANTGYSIVDVLVDGLSQGAITSYTFSNVITNHTIAATFAILTYTITPTAGAGGTITPGTVQTVNHGGNATFTIAPNPGYRILDVKVDGVSNPAAVTAGSYTFSNVTVNHTIEATFAILTYTIIPSAGAGGTITPGTPQTVNYGGNATFTIAPNPYYKIVDVAVDGVSQGAIASYTFTNVTADHVITATFTKIRTFLPLIFR